MTAFFLTAALELDSRWLWLGALLHIVIAVACLFWLFFDGSTILGVHPAMKPLKFGFSIAVFLATLALVVPMLSVEAPIKTLLSLIFLLTMLTEMAPMALQALRGTTSHFNVGGTFDAFLWKLMFFAIVIATVTMGVVAWIATIRPLLSHNGAPLDPLVALALRTGLWFFQLAAVSGFAMGGRMQHSVGGADGGAGVPILNWSLTHGDLRVSHFFALHAMQTLPLIAGGIKYFAMSGFASWTILALAIVVHAVVILRTLFQAFGGVPVW